MSEVKVFKIVTGEEVVAELVSQRFVSDANVPEKIVSYSIRRPHTLQFQQVAPGQIGLAFVPWVLSNPSIEELKVPASAVIIPPFDADPQVERQYLEQTSGISLSAAISPSKFVKV